MINRRQSSTQESWISRQNPNLSGSRLNKAEAFLYKVTMENKDQKVKINLFYCSSGERMKSKQNAVDMNNALNTGAADKCSSSVNSNRIQL